MNQIEFIAHGRRWHADLGRPADLAIPLQFDGAQPRFFVESGARAEPLQAGSFTGSVAGGASCNCATLTLAPHCHGTHTECVGHVTRDPVSLADLTPVALALALLVTVSPRPRGDAASGPHAAATDLVVHREDLSAATREWLDDGWTALVVRTLPNDPGKQSRVYGGSPSPAPYFHADAMRWIVERGVTSLVCDLPSLDRADDGGRLEAHRLYWGLPPGAVTATLDGRGRALVTELAYVPDTVRDGLYLLDLQVPAFASDAAPSRPVLYPLTAAGGAVRA